ncbi:MAG: ParB/RepB/Spo0J family partition protein [Phycisphaerales bacterium]
MSEKSTGTNSAAKNTASGKKSGRVKRSRLGRGLSALVETPAVEPVVVEAPVKSDNSGIGKNTQPSTGHGGGGGLGEGERAGGGAGGRSGRVPGGVGGGAGSAVDGRKSSDLSRAAEGELGGSVDGDAGVAQDDAASLAGGERVVELSVGVIRVNRDQPRRVFDEDRLNDLAGSIAVHGVMQPIVVRVVADGANVDSALDGKTLTPALSQGERGEAYELIAGERRWRASQIAGLETIPAIVRVVDDETSAQLALIENVQREDLNVIELAEGYRVLSDRYGMTQEQISGTVGVSRSLVANTVRLLDLPDEVRGLIVEGKLSSGHGKVLLSLGAPEKQRKFAARCLKEGWNIRLLQKACDDDADGVDVPAQGESHQSNTDPHARGTPEEDRALSVLRDLERQVGEELGTRVKIRTDKSRTRGRVVIEFFDLDQFDGLLGRLGVTTRG